MRTVFLDWFDSATDHDELSHDCSLFLELRERDKGQGKAYAYQCTRCGEAKGSEVAKRHVTLPVPEFDKDLTDRFEQKRRQISDLYKATRTYIPEEPAYKQIGRRLDECLEELSLEFTPEQITESVMTYLMRQRESHVNQLVTGWKSEEELTNWLLYELEPDFHILREAPGVGYINGQEKNIRIDLIIKAKQHLLNAGFTEQFIGIEVKFLDYASGKGFHGKSSKGIFQALSYWYSNAVWDVGADQPVNLAGVMLFSNLSFPEERTHLFNSYDRYYRTLWRAYSSIASQANVGELIIKDYGNTRSGWAMEYNGDKYFTKHPDGYYVKGNANLINKTRIGNAGRKRGRR